jgi:1,2-phenylacetyl-CoA epoxidase catalytic subunit
VQLRLLDWAHAIARRCLYEQADRARIEALKRSADAEIAGLAAKIDREEAYHRMHAELWATRLRDEPRFAHALEELRPYVEAERVATAELGELWEEMTSVRRSAPGAAW